MEITTQIMFGKQSYFSGEVIRGQIFVTNGTTMPLRLRERISISFDGFSKTNLMGRKVKNQESAMVWTNRRNSVGQEVYLQAKIFLTPEDSDSVELAPGQNGFPFTFELPAFLPSTYYSLLGAIHYEASTSFTVGHLYPVVCSNKITFRVINFQDLNLNSLAGLNSYFSFEKLVPISSSFRLRQKHEFGLVNTTVKIPSQGFVPGETIHLAMQLFYPTGLDIKKVLAELTCETSFACPGGSITESTSVSNSAAVRPRESEQGHLIAHLDIPYDTLPTTSHSCYLISLKYYVTISIQLPNSIHHVTVGKFPVIIGTVALRQLESVQRGTERREDVRQNHQLEIEGAVGGNQYAPSAPVLRPGFSDDESDDIPPSYLEAVNMTAPSSPLPQESESS